MSFNKNISKILKHLFARKDEWEGRTPPGKLMFNAFNLTPFDEVKVVILGKRAYHGPGQAHGLSLEFPIGVRIPPSLQNIYKEIGQDLGIETPNHGNLSSWAKQGVLLLNAVLSVNASEPASHKAAGWENFTNAVIHHLSLKKNNLVFLLWGRFAQEKELLIDNGKRLIFKGSTSITIFGLSRIFRM